MYDFILKKKFSYEETTKLSTFLTVSLFCVSSKILVAWYLRLILRSLMRARILKKFAYQDIYS